MSTCEVNERSLVPGARAGVSKDWEKAMVTDHPNAETWPKDLAWIIAELRCERRQDFVETPVDTGPPKRRAKNTPYDVLAGTVTLNDATWKDVEAMIARNQYNLYRVADSETGEPRIVAFLEPPRARKLSTSVPDSTAHEIDFVLKVM